MSFDQEFKGLLEDAEVSAFGLARAHLRYGKCVAYLRIGPRLLGKGDFPSCVQIASVNVPDADQGKGHFSAMFERILALTDKPIFVESILNKKFGDALLKRGFTVVTDYEGMSRDMVLRR